MQETSYKNRINGKVVLKNLQHLGLTIAGLIHSLHPNPKRQSCLSGKKRRIRCKVLVDKTRWTLRNRHGAGTLPEAYAVNNNIHLNQNNKQCL